MGDIALYCMCYVQPFRKGNILDIYMVKHRNTNLLSLMKEVAVMKD